MLNFLNCQNDPVNDLTPKLYKYLRIIPYQEDIDIIRNYYQKKN